MMRSAFEEHGEPDGEFARIMEELEADRKSDFESQRKGKD
jgi:hypothetical protein